MVPPHFVFRSRLLRDFFRARKSGARIEMLTSFYLGLLSEGRRGLGSYFRRCLQLCEQIIGRLDIAKSHQKLAQRVIVQIIRLVGVAV